MPQACAHSPKTQACRTRQGAREASDWAVRVDHRPSMAPMIHAQSAVSTWPEVCPPCSGGSFMQLQRAIAVTVVALSLTACGYSIKTASDYDRDVNFKSYKTFFMMKGNSSGNPLLDQRAAADVRQALASKGW